VHPVSLTSKWLAAGRAIETCRPDRLFEDPFAGALAGRDGFEQLEKFEKSDPRHAGQAPIMALRTHFFDRVIAAEVPAGRRQVVILAAGMDSRAFRLPWAAGTVLYEIDHGAVLDEKNEWLRHLGARARCDRRCVATDLRTDWASPLIKAGFDIAAPSAWILEGLLVYLPTQGAHRLLDTIGALSAAGSWIGFDLPSQTLLQSPTMVGPLAFLSKLGSPWTFASDVPAQIVERHGWKGTVTDAATFAAEVKRPLSSVQRATAEQTNFVSSRTMADHYSSTSVPVINPALLRQSRK
jgi:methyltransferase (TIGR00027 family)